MIIYEVNLIIKNEIFVSYYDWLMEHIKVMLKFSGFQHAEIAEEKVNTIENKNLTVRYIIASENDLNDYLQNHASIMRAEAVAKFGDQFSASRRVFLKFIDV